MGISFICNNKVYPSTSAAAIDNSLSRELPIMAWLPSHDSLNVALEQYNTISLLHSLNVGLVLDLMA